MTAEFGRHDRLGRHAEGRGPQTRIRTGIGGWVFPAWRKDFYPDGLPQREELEYASRQLRAIEINGTYYRAQTPAVYAKWREATPSGFIFSVKAPRYIVEQTRLATTRNAVKRFVSGGLAELGDRLGPLLWQFPASRPFEPGDIHTFLDFLPQQLHGQPLRHVLSVRHADFLCVDYLELMRERGLASVFTDDDTYPSFADLTGDLVYARLKQSRTDISTGYDEQALARWTKHAKMWAEGGDPTDLPHVIKPRRESSTPRDVFIFFIGAAKQRNPAAAMRLQQLIDT